MVYVLYLADTIKIENFNKNIGALSVKLTVKDMKELESYASVDVVEVISIQLPMMLKLSENIVTFVSNPPKVHYGKSNIHPTVFLKSQNNMDDFYTRTHAFLWSETNVMDCSYITWY
ncbi:hypothetical protein HAX54_042917 [Datura stramonium]|uniref:Uncharacterized protein n=1 Tax=Datura stramonium TaxID=4076 RepID=A0ABS8W4Q9_DATST|nr:hypothetical protein [Datura stramonium]